MIESPNSVKSITPYHTHDNSCALQFLGLLRNHQGLSFMMNVRSPVPQGLTTRGLGSSRSSPDKDQVLCLLLVNKDSRSQNRSQPLWPSISCVLYLIQTSYLRSPREDISVSFKLVILDKQAFDVF